MRELLKVSGSLPLWLFATLAPVSLGAGQNMPLKANQPATNVFPVAIQDTVTVVPGARYGAGWMKRWLLGDHYRALWTTPLSVPVLDLGRTGGRLTPERRIGGKANPGAAIPFGGREDIHLSLARQGRVAHAGARSTRHLGAGRGAGPDQRRAPRWAFGRLGGDADSRRARWHPDAGGSPATERLGTFGKEFAGMLGYIEVAEDETPLGPGQSTFVDVVSTERMIARLREHPQESVDARRFLTARLVDFFLGDWDRHRGQWRWGRRTRQAAWEPIPNQPGPGPGSLRWAGTGTGSAGVHASLGGLHRRRSDGRAHLERPRPRPSHLLRLDRAAWDSITHTSVA